MTDEVLVVDPVELKPGWDYSPVSGVFDFLYFRNPRFGKPSPEAIRLQPAVVLVEKCGGGPGMPCSTCSGKGHTGRVAAFKNIERRAAVQGEESGPDGERPPHGSWGYFIQPGTIAWSEHLEAFEAYEWRYGRGQSAKRIHQMGGFSYYELLEFLGRRPKTWLAHGKKPKDLWSIAVTGVVTAGDGYNWGNEPSFPLCLNTVAHVQLAKVGIEGLPNPEWKGLLLHKNTLYVIGVGVAMVDDIPESAEWWDANESDQHATLLHDMAAKDPLSRALWGQLGKVL